MGEKEARFYDELSDNRLICTLCPRNCKLKEGQSGFCFVRRNQDGRMVLLAYGKPTAVNVDPVEKKPLFHFLPGTQILSIGTAGCNLGCKFCQNWHISKAQMDQVRTYDLLPEKVVALAISHNAPSIAFTYNEPTIYAEYVIDVSKIAHLQGIKTVMVTNGYISESAIPEVYSHIDAANVDLKAFSNSFYKNFTYSHLEPVLKALILMKKMGVWVEITTLLIPRENTEPGEIKALSRWILKNLGSEVPLHFTAFHPDYKMKDRERTKPETLRMARTIAMEEGLKYVYEGNVMSDGSNTYCPACGRLLIQRVWHEVVRRELVNGSVCVCGEKIPIVV